MFSALFGLLLAGGCGPGTGGTGTGPSPTAGVTITTSQYISQGAVTTAPIGPNSGATAGPPVSYQLVIESQSVRLSGPCVSFRFEGAGIGSASDLSVSGTLRVAAPGGDPATAPAQPATLTTRTEGNGLRVTLQDATGKLLLSFATGAKQADGITLPAVATCAVAAF
jgi:hypothetical protein